MEDAFELVVAVLVEAIVRSGAVKRREFTDLLSAAEAKEVDYEAPMREMRALIKHLGKRPDLYFAA